MSPGASVQSVALVGSPLGTLFGTGSRTNPDGSFDLDDNGFPQITSSFVVLGDPNPDWRAGLGFNLSYKNAQDLTDEVILLVSKMYFGEKESKDFKKN